MMEGPFKRGMKHSSRCDGEMSAQCTKHLCDLLPDLEHKVTDLIEKVRRLDQKEIDMADNSDRSYTELGQLQLELIQIWNQCWPNTLNAPAEKVFKFQGTAYCQINRAISSYVNIREVLPSHREVQEIIIRCNSHYGLQLQYEVIESMAVDVLTTIIRDVQQQRQEELMADLEARLAAHPSDPAITDPSLRKKLKNNRHKGKATINKKCHLKQILEMSHDMRGDGTDWYDITNTDEPWALRTSGTGKQAAPTAANPMDESRVQRPTRRITPELIMRGYCNNSTKKRTSMNSRALTRPCDVIKDSTNVTKMCAAEKTKYLVEPCSVEDRVTAVDFRAQNSKVHTKADNGETSKFIVRPGSLKVNPCMVKVKPCEVKVSPGTVKVKPCNVKVNLSSVKVKDIVKPCSVSLKDVAKLRTPLHNNDVAKASRVQQITASAEPNPSPATGDVCRPVTVVQAITPNTKRQQEHDRLLASEFLGSSVSLSCSQQATSCSSTTVQQRNITNQKKCRESDQALFFPECKELSGALRPLSCRESPGYLYCTPSADLQRKVARKTRRKDPHQTRVSSQHRELIIEPTMSANCTEPSWYLSPANTPLSEQREEFDQHLPHSLGLTVSPICMQSPTTLQRKTPNVSQPESDQPSCNKWDISGAAESPRSPKFSTPKTALTEQNKISQQSLSSSCRPSLSLSCGEPSRSFTTSTVLSNTSLSKAQKESDRSRLSTCEPSVSSGCRKSKLSSTPKKSTGLVTLYLFPESKKSDASSLMNQSEELKPSAASDNSSRRLLTPHDSCRESHRNVARDCRSERIGSPDSPIVIDGRECRILGRLYYLPHDADSPHADSPQALHCQHLVDPWGHTDPSQPMGSVPAGDKQNQRPSTAQDGTIEVIDLTKDSYVLGEGSEEELSSPKRFSDASSEDLEVCRDSEKITQENLTEPLDLDHVINLMSDDDALGEGSEEELVRNQIMDTSSVELELCVSSERRSDKTLDADFTAGSHAFGDGTEVTLSDVNLCETHEQEPGAENGSEEHQNKPSDAGVFCREVEAGKNSEDRSEEHQTEALNADVTDIPGDHATFAAASGHTLSGTELCEASWVIGENKALAEGSAEILTRLRTEKILSSLQCCAVSADEFQAEKDSENLYDQRLKLRVDSNVLHLRGDNGSMAEESEETIRQSRPGIFSVLSGEGNLYYKGGGPFKLSKLSLMTTGENDPSVIVLDEEQSPPQMNKTSPAPTDDDPRSTHAASCILEDIAKAEMLHLKKKSTVEVSWTKGLVSRVRDVLASKVDKKRPIQPKNSGDEEEERPVQESKIHREESVQSQHSERSAVHEGEQMQDEQSTKVPDEPIQSREEISHTHRKKPIQSREEISHTHGKEPIQSQEEISHTHRKEPIQYREEISHTHRKESMQPQEEESSHTHGKEPIKPQISGNNKSKKNKEKQCQSNQGSEMHEEEVVQPQDSHRTMVASHDEEVFQPQDSHRTMVASHHEEDIFQPQDSHRMMVTSHHEEEVVQPQDSHRTMVTSHHEEEVVQPQDSHRMMVASHHEEEVFQPQDSHKTMVASHHEEEVVQPQDSHRTMVTSHHEDIFQSQDSHRTMVASHHKEEVVQPKDSHRTMVASHHHSVMTALSQIMRKAIDSSPQSRTRGRNAAPVVRHDNLARGAGQPLQARVLNSHHSERSSEVGRKHDIVQIKDKEILQTYQPATVSHSETAVKADVRSDTSENEDIEMAPGSMASGISFESGDDNDPLAIKLLVIDTERTPARQSQKMPEPSDVAVDLRTDRAKSLSANADDENILQLIQDPPASHQENSETCGKETGKLHQPISNKNSPSDVMFDDVLDLSQKMSWTDDRPTHPPCPLPNTNAAAGEKDGGVHNGNLTQISKVGWHSIEKTCQLTMAIYKEDQLAVEKYASMDKNRKQFEPDLFFTPEKHWTKDVQVCLDTQYTDSIVYSSGGKPIRAIQECTANGAAQVESLSTEMQEFHEQRYILVRGEGERHHGSKSALPIRRQDRNLDNSDGVKNNRKCLISPNQGCVPKDKNTGLPQWTQDPWRDVTRDQLGFPKSPGRVGQIAANLPCIVHHRVLPAHKKVLQDTEGLAPHQEIMSQEETEKQSTNKTVEQVEGSEEENASIVFHKQSREKCRRHEPGTGITVQHMKKCREESGITLQQVMESGEENAGVTFHKQSGKDAQNSSHGGRKLLQQAMFERPIIALRKQCDATRTAGPSIMHVHPIPPHTKLSVVQPPTQIAQDGNIQQKVPHSETYTLQVSHNFSIIQPQSSLSSSTPEAGQCQIEVGAQMLRTPEAGNRMSEVGAHTSSSQTETCVTPSKFVDSHQADSEPHQMTTKMQAAADTVIHTTETTKHSNSSQTPVSVGIATTTTNGGLCLSKTEKHLQQRRIPQAEASPSVQGIADAVIHTTKKTKHSNSSQILVSDVRSNLSTSVKPKMSEEDVSTTGVRKSTSVSQTKASIGTRTPTDLRPHLSKLHSSKKRISQSEISTTEFSKHFTVSEPPAAEFQTEDSCVPKLQRILQVKPSTSGVGTHSSSSLPQACVNPVRSSPSQDLRLSKLQTTLKIRSDISAHPVREHSNICQSLPRMEKKLQRSKGEASALEVCPVIAPAGSLQLQSGSLQTPPWVRRKSERDVVSTQVSRDVRQSLPIIPAIELDPQIGKLQSRSKGEASVPEISKHPSINPPKASPRLKSGVLPLSPWPKKKSETEVGTAQVRKHSDVNQTQAPVGGNMIAKVISQVLPRIPAIESDPQIVELQKRSRTEGSFSEVSKHSRISPPKVSVGLVRIGSPVPQLKPSALQMLPWAKNESETKVGTAQVRKHSGVNQPPAPDRAARISAEQDCRFAEIWNAIQQKLSEGRTPPTEVVKQASISTESVKQPSISTESVKQPSISTESVKQPSISTESVKQPSISTESVKQPSISTESVKQPSISTKSVQQPSISTESVKQPSISTTRASVGAARILTNCDPRLAKRQENKHQMTSEGQCSTKTGSKHPSVSQMQGRVRPYRYPAHDSKTESDAHQSKTKRPGVKRHLAFDSPEVSKKPHIKCKNIKRVHWGSVEYWSSSDDQVVSSYASLCNTSTHQLFDQSSNSQSQQHGENTAGTPYNQTSHCELNTQNDTQTGGLSTAGGNEWWWGGPGDPPSSQAEQGSYHHQFETSSHLMTQQNQTASHHPYQQAPVSTMTQQNQTPSHHPYQQAPVSTIASNACSLLEANQMKDATAHGKSRDENDPYIEEYMKYIIQGPSCILRTHPPPVQKQSVGVQQQTNVLSHCPYQQSPASVQLQIPSHHTHQQSPAGVQLQLPSHHTHQQSPAGVQLQLPSHQTHQQSPSGIHRHTVGSVQQAPYTDTTNLVTHMNVLYRPSHLPPRGGFQSGVGFTGVPQGRQSQRSSPNCSQRRARVRTRWSPASYSSVKKGT